MFLFIDIYQLGNMAWNCYVIIGKSGLQDLFACKKTY